MFNLACYLLAGDLNLQVTGNSNGGKAPQLGNISKLPMASITDR
ncbi:hypothetical protein QUB70_11980 [Microcoleus sp. A003_D6]